MYNSLRVAISYLNELHDEPIPLRISLSTIQGWFPLSVTQAWVAQETLKIKQECAVWSDYLKDFGLFELINWSDSFWKLIDSIHSFLFKTVSTSDSRYAHFNKRSTESVRMLGAHSQKSMVVLSTSSQGWSS